MSKEYNELLKVGKEFKKILGLNKLSDDEVKYEIIKGLKGKKIADDWLKYNNTLYKRNEIKVENLH